jgi:hypothetical protein
MKPMSGISNQSELSSRGINRPTSARSTNLLPSTTVQQRAMTAPRSFSGNAPFVPPSINIKPIPTLNNNLPVNVATPQIPSGIARRPLSPRDTTEIVVNGVVVDSSALPPIQIMPPSIDPVIEDKPSSVEDDAITSPAPVSPVSANKVTSPAPVSSPINKVTSPVPVSSPAPVSANKVTSPAPVSSPAPVPRISSPINKVTSPAPVSSPINKVTSPAPVSSPNNKVTSPAPVPRISSPNNKVTSPAPVSSPNNKVTSPAPVPRISSPPITSPAPVPRISSPANTITSPAPVPRISSPITSPAPQRPSSPRESLASIPILPIIDDGESSESETPIGSANIPVVLPTDNNTPSSPQIPVFVESSPEPTPPPPKKQPSLAEIYSAMSLEDQARRRADFRIKLGILRKAYPSTGIPDFEENVPLDVIHAQYDRYVQQIYVDNNVSQYKIYLIVMWLIVEGVCIKFMGLDMSGYTMSQLSIMNRYDRLLIELGEKNQAPTAPQWPVEIRIILLSLFNAVIFLIVKVATNWIGPGIGPMIHKVISGVLSGNNVQSLVSDLNNNNTAAAASGKLESTGLNIGGFDLGSILGSLGGILGGLSGNSTQENKETTKPRSSRRPRYSE